MPTPWFDARISPANPPRPPTYANTSTVLATLGSGRPGVISHRNHNIETITTIPKNTGYAVVP